MLRREKDISGPEASSWPKVGESLTVQTSIFPNDDQPSFSIAETLVFSAQHPPGKMVEGPIGGSNSATYCKRARSHQEEPTVMPSRGRGDSFKSKLLGATNPSTWLGFGSGKERISIENSDIVLVEGSNGQDVMLFEELKTKLHKP
ncbi:hypothetical protein ACOSQ3_018639 [Xanthoceras sorbifolium]